MADWVSIIGLIIAIIALAGVVGLLIWYLIANSANNSVNTITTITGNTVTYQFGGGDAVLISQSTATADLVIGITSNSSATLGKMLWIINNGQGRIVASGPTGNTVVFPATTLAVGTSAAYILTASNQYVRWL